MDLSTLRTPCVVLDYEKLRRNVQVMSERASSLGVHLRPHVKTHKCIEIARLQCPGNRERITVSTLEEARFFSAAGFSDILYAVPVEPGKFADAAEISRQCKKFLLLTDDPSIASELSEYAERSGLRFGVFLDVDCGYGRTGVRPSASVGLEIVRAISESRNLDFAGILTHAGNSYGARSREQLLAIARQERDEMAGFAQQLRQHGFDVPLVSIGSTPTMSAVDHLNGIDEARPGNYVFYDLSQAALGACTFQDCAFSVLTAVVSKDKRQRQVVFDAGAIALSKDQGPVQLQPHCGYGQVLDLEGNDLGFPIHSLSQEHGLAEVTDEAIFERLRVGARVRVSVNHSCLTAAQHDCYHVLDNGQIVDQWRPCRGW